MIPKTFLNFILCTFILAITIASLQTIMTIHFTYKATKATDTELLVVFPGDIHRLTTAVEHLKTTNVKYLMVIGKSVENLKAILKQVQLSCQVTPLPGGSSRSTFEDVCQTVKTIKEHQITNVSLVTSGYHLPRSVFLLKTQMYLSNATAKIITIPSTYQEPFERTVKHYINENIKLIGSIFELTSSFMISDRILDKPSARKLQQAAKSFLIFNM